MNADERRLMAAKKAQMAQDGLNDNIPFLFF